MKILYRIKQSIVIIGDILSYTLGLWIAIAVRRWMIPGITDMQAVLGLFFITFFLWLIVNYINGLYDLGMHKTQGEFYRRFTETAFIALLVGIIFFYIHPNRDITPKTILVLTVAIGYILSGFWRLGADRLLNGKHLQTRILFIGMTAEVKELIEILYKHPEKGYKPVAVIDPNMHYTLPSDIDIFKDFQKIRPVISTRDISMVIVSDQSKQSDNVMRELYELLFWSIQIQQVGAFYEMITGRVSPSTFSESWFLDHLRNKEQPIYTRIRRLSDYLAVCILGIFFILLLPIVALAIRLNSPGPIFFKQARVGKSGKQFTLYKFRSMYALAKDGSAEIEGYQFATKNDSRITAVGKILRKTRIDELPQILNLIKGEITLIGPRPERPQIVEKLTTHMPYYPLRHIVAPGLTGWAVIHQNYTDTIKRSLEKFQYDLFYIKNRSLLLDISILLRTINIIFRGLGQ